MQFLAIILAALKFPTEMSAFIKLLQSTPQEKHDALMVQIADQAKSFQETGRPS